MFKTTENSNWKFSQSLISESEALKEFENSFSYKETGRTFLIKIERRNNE